MAAIKRKVKIVSLLDAAFKAKTRAVRQSEAGIINRHIFALCQERGTEALNREFLIRARLQRGTAVGLQSRNI